MTERSLGEPWPVDFLIVEFPAGAYHFTGDGADELGAEALVAGVTAPTAYAASIC